MQVITDVMQTAINTNTILQRWKKVISTMIEKVKGQPLRVITIFEADFNLLMGHFWSRKLMWENECKHNLGDEQWGSRPARSAIDALFLKHLTYKIATITHTDLATFDNDAKACYDHMLRSQ